MLLVRVVPSLVLDTASWGGAYAELVVFALSSYAVLKLLMKGSGAFVCRPQLKQ